MRQGFRRCWVGCWGVALFAAAASAQPQVPTFSLKAVKRNGVAIPGGPTNSTTASPGDTIEAEIFLSGWSPSNQRLAGWQVFVGTTSGFTSGARGSFDFIPAPRACTNDEGCDDIAGTCVGGFCTSNPPDHPRAAGVKMDEDRADFVYDDEIATPHFIIVDLGIVGDAGVRFAAQAISGYPLYNPAGTGTPPVETSPKYCGTIIMRSTFDACGTFTIPLLPSPDSSLTDQTTNPIPIGSLQSLSINLGGCPCTAILATNPPHCAIDARQTGEPIGLQTTGSNSIEIQLNCNAASPARTCADFIVTQDPSGQPGIGCSSVNTNIRPDPSWVRVNFTRVISTRRWTCVEFTLEGKPYCIGYLPADVGGDRVVATPADVNRLINCLDGDPPCDISQCDLDRSGLCTSEDLNREADLQNGGDDYVVWRGLDIPSVCPPQ